VKIERSEDAASAASAAAAFLAAEARAAIAKRGRFVVALSGGSTPWLMLRALAQEKLRWEAVQILQVDERVAPRGHPDRNLTHFIENLRQPQSQIQPMPVESPDLEVAAWQYEQTIANLAGSPAVLDLVHLGLGADGHTASLVPGDPVLKMTDVDVAITRPYQGRRRMTLTYPILNRARRVLWLVTGAEKAPALRLLQAADPSIPAGRVRQDSAVIFADRTAATAISA
jgi:6-phosphogluconolactonase